MSHTSGCLSDFSSQVTALFMSPVEWSCSSAHWFIVIVVRSSLVMKVNWKWINAEWSSDREKRGSLCPFQFNVMKASWDWCMTIQCDSLIMDVQLNYQTVCQGWRARNNTTQYISLYNSYSMQCHCSSLKKIFIVVSGFCDKSPDAGMVGLILIYVNLINQSM